MIDFASLKVDENWSFSEVKRAESMYASHGYHRYPAKFIPQIVQKLLKEYSMERDVVLDPFGGCGTTLIEAKINGRQGISIDVNRVAVLIAKAKMHGIEPELLKEKNDLLLQRIKNCKDKTNFFRAAHPRLKYWFKWHQYNKLQRIYNCILQEQANRIQNFYLCCFSNILKNCSIWYSKSIKPMRDLGKKLEKPNDAFKRHLNYMTKMNEDFFNLLGEKQTLDSACKVLKGDARNLNLAGNSVDLIITSPPYVTSYEYAELHQLSTLWFGFADDIKKMSKGFIGTSSRKRTRKVVNSKIAETSLEKLSRKRQSLSRHISNYYFDLAKCYKEMHRVLKKSKYLGLIIGNTEYLNVRIPNAEISIELLENIGFDIKRIIKRKLSSKIFTPYRDKTGKFTSTEYGRKRKIYQYEYIIIAKK